MLAHEFEMCHILASFSLVHIFMQLFPCFKKTFGLCLSYMNKWFLKQKFLNDTIQLSYFSPLEKECSPLFE